MLGLDPAEILLDPKLYGVYYINEEVKTEGERSAADLVSEAMNAKTKSSSSSDPVFLLANAAMRQARENYRTDRIVQYVTLECVDCFDFHSS